MKKILRRHASVDQVLLIITSILVVLGFVIMASASSSIADSSFYYVNKQAVALAIGAVGAWVAFNIPYIFWRRRRGLVLMSIVGLLLAVLLFGHEIRGGKRWITIGGFSLQIVEFVKVGMVLYVASYLNQYRNIIQQDIWPLIMLLVWGLVVFFLILLQPDFGNAVILMTVTVTMAYMSGIKARWLALLFILGIAGIVFLVLLEPYRMVRISSYLDGLRDPLSNLNDDGFQRSRSLSAIARGGLFGQGLGDSLFKHGKLPFAHSDFIFSIYAEELGLIGVVFLLFLFGMFVIRAFQIGLRAESVQRYFVANVCFGLGILFAVQWIFNICICLSLLPPKGMAMPFFSVGGSSLMASLIAVGILARAKYEVDLMEDVSQSEWYEEMQDIEAADREAQERALNNMKTADTPLFNDDPVDMAGY